MDIDDYTNKHDREIMRWLSEGMDRNEATSRFQAMLSAEFPSAKTTRSIASMAVLQAFEQLKHLPSGTPVSLNLHIGDVHNHLSEGLPPNKATPSAVPAAPKARRVSLPFRLLKDTRLDLTDRILFSLCWKWSHFNAKQKRTPKPFSIAKMRKFTGFRPATIKSSLALLLLYGYLNENHQPLIQKVGKTYTLNNGVKYMGFRKLSWTIGVEVKRAVFEGVRMSNQKPSQNRQAWYSKALGISRWTAKRWMAPCNGCYIPL